MEEIVDRYYQALYRFALSLARNESIASDLTQETYYLLAAKGYQLRDSSKIKTWLFTTLYREFLSRHRHESRFPHYETTEVESELPVISSTVVNHMDAELVMHALQSVDLVYRAPLSMFYIDDLSYKEIAEALDLPIGTIMSRLSRGKQQLRSRLGELKAAPESNVIPIHPSLPKTA